MSLYPTRTIQEWNEKIFLTDVWLIQEENGFFYLNNYRTHQIFVIDSFLNLIDFFGKKGNGPGEFQGAGSFMVHQNFIYVHDNGGNRLNVFTTGGEFERTIILPSGVRLFMDRFAILDNNAFFPTRVNMESDILMVDLISGKVVNEVNLNPNSETVEIKHRTILSFEDQAIAIHKLAPVIERFSNTGVLLEEFDLTNIGGLDGLWSHYDNHKHQNRLEHSIVIFQDAYIDGTFLYVLCAPWLGRDEYSYIIKLQLDKERIEPQNIFKIQGADPSARFFQSLAVVGDRLIAIEGSSQSINEFDLSKLD